MHRYSSSKLREKMRRCLAGLRENVSKNHSPENTAARTLERVTWPFHVVVLAGVLNDPAEQARANKVRLHPQTLQLYLLVNGTGHKFNECAPEKISIPDFLVPDSVSLNKEKRSFPMPSWTQRSSRENTSGYR
jgi:hypothetical protein